MAPPSNGKKKNSPNSNSKSKNRLKPKKSAMKSSKRKNDSKPEQPPLVQFEDEAPDFPRGGGNLLSRQEEEEIRAEVDAEFAAEQRESKKKKKPRKSDRGEDDLGSLFGDGVAGRAPRYANRITLKNISPGMKLLGVVMEVNLKDLIISLPGGLRGFVRAEESSDLLDSGNKDHESTSLCSMFDVGQLVSCIVLRVDEDKREGKGHKKIWLSLRLGLLHKGLTLDALQDGMVITAYVKSIEDHGYILHFGLSSFSGFLPKKSQGDSTEIKMSIGKLLQGVVRSIDKARGVVYLDSNPDVVSKCVVKDVKGLSIDLLTPGMMVNGRVLSTLENGIMITFLTYFTGTVDVFHLQNSFPNSTWKNDYFANKKVNARILFIDPSTRAVGLTMNSHLVCNKAPPLYVKTGDIYDNSRIIRVDKGFGLMLEIPSTPVSTPAYVSASDVSDAEVLKLDKKFKEGSHVRIRVLGCRHLEGLAMGVLKASAFEGTIFTHADVKPGMVVKAKVISVEDFGAFVQFTSGIKALCPLRHMSELDIVKPPKKFKVGSELLFRVLGCKSKRITVTHKKTLVRSKLDILASYADATDGFVTHGWITKTEKHGCVVRFYNGVQGFAHRSELGLEPGGEASSMYHVGQVVKCRVINAVPASRKINLSFNISAKRASFDGDVAKLGSLVSGVVERLTPSAVIIDVNGKGYFKGSIFNEHLADHQGHAASLKSLLKPGYKFDNLLVLDLDGLNFILSAKHSLINSANQIPSDISQIQPHTVVHGYICNSIEAGYFVRFLGHLTGFSSKNRATDDQKLGHCSFYIGQSVRSYILNVDGEKERISVSLKQSSCFSIDASLIQGYFLSEEKIADLQLSESNTCGFGWVEKIKIGALVEGEIQERKEFGAVINFREYGDVVGFIAHHQMGGKDLDTGAVVRALVLDLSKADSIVDLSLKPELVSSVCEDGLERLSFKKKRRRVLCKDLELHQSVNAVVEIVKDNYLVLSIPDHNHAIGFASIFDYNTQKLPIKHFVNGQSVVATIESLPSPSTAGRLLLLLKSLSEVTETSRAKRAKRKSSYNVGSLVEAEITEIKPLELRVKFGINFHGRLHITEVIDDDHFMENPFCSFRVGQLLTAKIVASGHQIGKSKKGSQWELSVKPSILAGTTEIVDEIQPENFNFSVGKIVNGYVSKVEKEWIWLTVSRHIKAQLFLLDCSCEPSELQEFLKRFNVGQAVSGSILSINKEKKLLRVTLCSSFISRGLPNGNDIVMRDDQGNVSSNNNTEHILEGDVLGGRVSKVLPGVSGLLVQIGPHLHGKVHFTEITDMLVPDPLNGYKEGQFVKCKVLEVGQSFNGSRHIDLSLRSSLVNIQSDNLAGACTDMDFSCKRFERIEDLCPNMDVQGYVKNITSKGCFIMLSRKIDAKILLSNLSDGYIEKPENEFPVGKLVNGKVLSVEPLSKRVEVTLRTATGNRTSKLEIGDLRRLHVGDVISGWIKRVESYGLFITIDYTNVVGLCHISQLSDSHIANIETKYKAGERVVAKILKVDEERNRVALGMKNCHTGNNIVVGAFTKYDSDGSNDGSGATDDSQRSVLPDDGFSSGLYCDDADSDLPVLVSAESRASVPPLEVRLDDMEGSGLEDPGVEINKDNEEQNIVDKKRRREKKKAKEERELEIRAAEERLLGQDIPRNADEFEKLVRSSPNSSFVWIKYMAFMLSMADVEKARSIAERALQTINIREEGEKMNIWVAYLNLENEYGTTPQEAVMKTFQRALHYCDPKKLHLALLDLYERTNQDKLGNELLDRMTKKFKSSCKVWLRRVQSFLKQGKDGIQSIVNHALPCLPRNKHIKFISHAAILEFKCGVPDRGRSLFEGILREYPKRTDLWSIYLDQEIRLADPEIIRALFERATCSSLPPKKMKFLFKKYLEYEKSCGDNERIEYVKKKAMDYVEAVL